MNIIIMGPQGSGKGTQAALLAEHYGIPHISTGDIFRANIKGGTPLGKEAQGFIDKGALVPDSLTDRLVADRLSQEDAQKGWILDGYPRNAAQLMALDEVLDSMGKKIDAVVVLSVSQKLLMERMENRALEEHRSDDTEDAIRQRLSIYEKETAPLIETYAMRGNVYHIDGEQDIKVVYRNIIDVLEK